MQLNFKQWMLNEMPTAMIASPEAKQKYTISLVDIRAEDWDIDESSPRAAEAQQIRAAIQRAGHRPNFYGKIPGDNRFLAYDDKLGRFAIVNNVPFNSICLDDLPIKRNWWNYIVAVDNDGRMVKEPHKPREHELVGSNQQTFVPVRQ